MHNLVESKLDSGCSQLGKSLRVPDPVAGNQVGVGHGELVDSRRYRFRKINEFIPAAIASDRIRCQLGAFVQPRQEQFVPNGQDNGADEKAHNTYR